MTTSVRGNDGKELSAPCPVCGYATRFKRFPITCACNRHLSRAELLAQVKAAKKAQKEDPNGREA